MPAIGSVCQILAGKKGLVTGIANEHSIAYGCAKAFRTCGAELAVTYLNEKAEPFVRPLADALNCPIVMPCDVQREGQLEGVVDRIARGWGRLGFLLHAIGFAAKAGLHGRVIDCSPEGFAIAMNVSCHSFLRMARLAEPLMTEGGSLLTVSYYGAEKVVSHYNVMGVAKAALEANVRYLAADLGPHGIRINAISAGPVRTLAAAGIAGFKRLYGSFAEVAPLRSNITIEDVGKTAVWLASDLSSAVTGEVVYVDGGFNVLGVPLADQ